MGPRKAYLVVAVGLVAAALVAFLGSLVPLELPELAVPSRIYARPHRIASGQSLDTAGLLDRMRRLGYREVEREPRPGEYRLKGRRLQIHRRAFQAPTGAGRETLIELRLDSNRRISSIRTAGGRRVPSVLLEPEVIGEFQGRQREDRTLVPLAELPVHLIDAVLAIEDRRFFEHGGLDLRRLAGAMLANLRALRIVQGGSTLTQQLVKNVFLTDERTIARKLREAWLALRVERTNTKEEILEAYLNTIYMGQRGPVSVRGMEAAARHYFGKPARELTLPDSALLAGLIRGPGLYSPFTVPETALARRNQVLGILRDTGDISQAEYDATIGLPIDPLPEAPAAVSAPYFSAYVRRELERNLPELDVDSARVDVYTGLDARLQVAAQRAVRRGLRQLEADFPNLEAESGDGDSPLQAALIAIDPRNGDVLAHVGGRDFRSSQFDRATQAYRQPGSVFKPIVALSALSRGSDGRPAFTLASHLEDEPLSVETPEGVWEPSNYDGEFHGTTSLRTAIEQSRNVPIARLGIELGPERIIETARRLGITSRLRPVPSLALGAFEVSPLEMARAYAVLASSGMSVVPRPYLRVVDVDGRELEGHAPRFEPVFAADEVRLVTSALLGAVDHGTGRSLRGYGFRGPVAGKTGTTNDFRDAWFVGYTPELVAVVWVGFDDGRSAGLTGARGALPIFARFIIDALGARGGLDFATPDGMEIVAINEQTGLRAGFGCFGEDEMFLAGTAPEKSCGPQWMRARDRTRRQRDTASPPREAPWFRALGAVLDALEELAKPDR